jgi:hypothetical protein
MGSSPQPPEPAAAEKEEVSMAYGLDPRLFLENGPANQAAEAHARRSSNSYRAWAGLDSEHRFELVEKALRNAANDRAGMPIAL